MAKIVIFDSGVGGLSIYNEVRAALPDQDYTFVSDNLGYPYGEKPTGWLVNRVMDVCDVIDNHCQPDILIVACNTASTVVLPELRRTHSMPVVGVVPAIKPAAQLTKTGHIGLLATPATIERAYTDQLIESFASECQVTKYGSSNLVEIAEQMLRGRLPDSKTIETELKSFIDQPGLDVLVLACTHFSLLIGEINESFKANNRSVLLIDSATAIAKRVATLLEEKQDDQSKQLNDSKSNNALFTRDIADEAHFLKKLSEFGLVYQGQLPINRQE
jgi:glutamate racemase